MHGFDVRSDYYRAVAPFVSREETRYYLGGVLIEPHPVEGVLLVATDGCRMMIAHDRSGSCDGTYITDMPPDALRSGKAKRTDPGPRRFRAENERTVSVIVPEHLLLDFEHDWRIDGTFPDWRKVLPKKLTGAPAAFDPAFLGDFAKVAEELRDSFAIQITTNGRDAALVEFSKDGFLGVIMPVAWSGVQRVPDFISLHRAAAK